MVDPLATVRVLAIMQNNNNAAWRRNYSCNNCVYSMQNSAGSRSMACEEDTGPCDWYEPIDETDSRSEESEY